jgi:putative oxidoreductase
MAVGAWAGKWERWCAERGDWGVLILRVIAGAHLVWGTQDNVLSWERMLEFRHFLAGAGFPLPLVSAVVSAWAQFLCGLLFIVGLFTRWAGAVMSFNFVVAIVMVELRRPYPAAYPALSLLAVSLCLVFTGAGRFSLDGRRRP